MKTTEFDEIYQRYFSDVFLYLRSVSSDPSVAEELTQETFLKALQAIDRFDGRGEIRAWLFTIAKRTYIDHCRREKRSAGGELREDLPDSRPLFTEYLADRETAFLIHRFLHGMKEPYKEVFSLRVFGELPFDQIARLFSKSSGWARVTFYRAKQQIMEYMEEVEHGNHSL